MQKLLLVSYHREHTILLGREGERVNKGTKRMNSLPLSPLIISFILHDFTGKTATWKEMTRGDKRKEKCQNVMFSGVQVNLPSLTAEDLEGSDEKTIFFTGIVNFGTFKLLFNSVTKLLWDLGLLYSSSFGF